MQDERWRIVWAQVHLHVPFPSMSYLVDDKNDKPIPSLVTFVCSFPLASETVAKSLNNQAFSSKIFTRILSKSHTHNGYPIWTLLSAKTALCSTLNACICLMQPASCTSPPESMISLTGDPVSAERLMECYPEGLPQLAFVAVFFIPSACMYLWHQLQLEQAIAHKKWCKKWGPGSESSQAWVWACGSISYITQNQLSWWASGKYCKRGEFR